jgi:hypothetical protein
MSQRDRSEAYKASMQEAFDRLQRAGRATAAQLAHPTDPDGRNMAGKLTALRTEGLVSYDPATRQYTPTKAT